MPADSLAILKLMAIQSSDHLESEIIRAQVSLLVGNKKTRDILPDDPSNSVKSFVEYSDIINNKDILRNKTFEKFNISNLGQFRNTPALKCLGPLIQIEHQANLVYWLLIHITA